MPRKYFNRAEEKFKVPNCNQIYLQAENAIMRTEMYSNSYPWKKTMNIQRQKASLSP